MCMSEYIEREFVAVPRLPLLTECAPLAAAVAGSSAGRRAQPIARYTDTRPPATHRGGSGKQRRPSWRFVRLRLGKTAHPEDHQQVELTADELPSTSACGSTIVGESSRVTTDSEPDPEIRRCDDQRQRLAEASTINDSSAGDAGPRKTANSGRSRLSTLESDVREVRRMLQAYALRLSERDAHARVTKQWRLVARVLDRLFFFVYCATITISLATFFPR